MSPTEITLIIVGIVVVAAVAAAAWYVMRRQSLRRRFGPEYDRMVAERESRPAAERELRERERRHAELELHPLSAESRATYASAWEEVQARFVDSPAEAVTAGDDLVTRLVAERGYPTGGYDEQLAHLSVEHARTLGHYRDAHDIHLRNQRGEASTEELRQALVHYRALFADLLGDNPLDRKTPVSRETASDAAHAPDGDHTPPDGENAPAPDPGNRPDERRPETPQDATRP